MQEEKWLEICETNSALFPKLPVYVFVDRIPDAYVI